MSDLEAVVKMIIKDLRPTSLVEKEGFRDLVSLLKPWYTMVSWQHITKHLPQFLIGCQDSLDSRWKCLRVT